MNFTKELPTKPGAYWWRPNESSPKSLLRIDDLGVAWPGGFQLPVDLKVIGGEWCRLVPADEIGKAHKEGWHDTAGPYFYQTAAFERSRAKRVMEGEE